VHGRGVSGSTSLLELNESHANIRCRISARLVPPLSNSKILKEPYDLLHDSFEQNRRKMSYYLMLGCTCQSGTSPLTSKTERLFDWNHRGARVIEPEPSRFCVTHIRSQ
jgi:hypothetical protein